MRRRPVAVAVLVAALSAPVAHAGAEDLPPLPRLPQSRMLIQHGPPVRPAPLFRSGFVAKADGFDIGVSTYGDAVYFEVWRKSRGRRIATAYLARGVARPERLQATFGNFGKVSMRFRESRGRPRSICRFGQVLVKRRGVFVGNLRFRGEGGYVSVRLHRAKGGIVTPGGRCRYRPRRGVLRELIELFFLPKAAVLALSRDGVDFTALLALEGRRSSAFLAMHEESRGKLAIIRLAEARKPRRHIRVSEALTSASLTPPSPFHGTGRYRAAPDGTTTWFGDLSVHFPGAPRFPLTGPGFEPFLEAPF
ncbi:MAG TPA: hypothetical protein VFM51_02645 [Solirubrobacterales bacterium]|nr:hypothetical protein [Solirubrobacterales bacterium]